MVPENPLKNRPGIDAPLVVVAALSATLAVVSNIMAVKLLAVGGVAWFDAGTVTFPMVYVLGDVLAEHWGFKIAKNVIWLTFACNLLATVATTIGIFLPVPDYQQDIQQAYQLLFQQVPRITAASFVAFLAGELSNAWSLQRIKALTGKRLLWVRTIGSSILGHALDTALFVVLAFAGTAPTQDLMTMFLVQFVCKLVLEAVFGTPLAYGALALIESFTSPKVLRS